MAEIGQQVCRVLANGKALRMVKKREQQRDDMLAVSAELIRAGAVGVADADFVQCYADAVVGRRCALAIAAECVALNTGIGDGAVFIQRFPALKSLRGGASANDRLTQLR